MLAVLYKHFINCYTIERLVTSYFNDCVMVYDLYITYSRCFTRKI